MNKIELLLELAQSNQVELAKITKHLEDLKPRCDSHSTDLKTHDVILRGDKENKLPGICEEIRTIKKASAQVATVTSLATSSGIILVIEYIKHKFFKG